MDKRFMKKPERPDAAKILAKIDYSTDQIKENCLDGVLLAVFLMGETGELFFNQLVAEMGGGDPTKILHQKLINRIAEEALERERKAMILIKELSKDPSALNEAIEALRNMILNGIIDSEGKRLSEKKEVTEDDLYRLLANKEAATPSDTHVISLKDGSTFLVDKNQEAMLSAIVKIDMKNNRGNGIFWRYICEIKTDNQVDVGSACCVKDAIIQAARESQLPELSDNRKLLLMAERGHIKCMAHAIIGMMETILDVSIDELKNADATVIEGYLHWLPLVNNAISINDDELETYIDENGRKLKGIDSNGSETSGNANTADCKRRYLSQLAKDVAKRLCAMVSMYTGTHPLEKEITKLYCDLIS